MVAPHDVLVSGDQLPHVMVADQTIRLLCVAEAVGENQIPDLVVLQHLPWENMVNVDVASLNGFSAIEAGVTLISLEKWDVTREVLPLVTTLQIREAEVVGKGIAILLD